MTVLAQAKEALALFTGDAEHDAYLIAAAIKHERDRCAAIAKAHEEERYPRCRGLVEKIQAGE